MSGVPFAVPLAWSQSGSFILQMARFCSQIGCDCLRCWEPIP